MKLSNDKLILVIGGTGAQGQAVVKALVEPSSEGAPSPYTVRILTRNPDHPKVKAEFNHIALTYLRRVDPSTKDARTRIYGRK